MTENSSAHDGDPTFAALRPKLFGIAYRVLGSSAEAEDVVQETWLRWQASDFSAVRNPAAFLATTATRLALNVVQSARSRRETYVGQCLPEIVDPRDDPALGAERREALELAVLLLLEKLRSRERAVYVLSEAFDYSYAQIGEMLQLTEAHARQLASRARKLLGGERRRAVSTEEHRRLLDAFSGAARAGDRAGLEQLLASDVVQLLGRWRSRRGGAPTCRRHGTRGEVRRPSTDDVDRIARPSRSAALSGPSGEERRPRCPRSRPSMARRSTTRTGARRLPSPSSSTTAGR